MTYNVSSGTLNLYTTYYKHLKHTESADVWPM